jgi:hypothetical protein
MGSPCLSLCLLPGNGAEFLRKRRPASAQQRCSCWSQTPATGAAVFFCVLCCVVWWWLACRQTFFSLSICTARRRLPSRHAAAAAALCTVSALLNCTHSPTTLSHYTHPLHSVPPAPHSLPVCLPVCLPACHRVALQLGLLISNICAFDFPSRCVINSTIPRRAAAHLASSEHSALHTDAALSHSCFRLLHLLPGVTDPRL